MYANVAKTGQKLLEEALDVAFPQTRAIQATNSAKDASYAAINTLMEQRTEVVKIPFSNIGQASKGATHSFVVMSDDTGSGAASVLAADSVDPVKIQIVENGSFKMSNAYLTVMISDGGRVTSIYDLVNKREIIAKGQSAGFVIFQ